MALFENIQQAIQALEQQRILLGDAAVDTAISSLRKQLDEKKKDPGEEISQLTAERKLVTILFADISGFTSMSEKSDPEEIRALMNKCFDWMVPIVLKYNGTVDKFIGDELMALFGAPHADEKHAEFACLAALDMLSALRSFNEENEINLGLHIGINTGMVVTGGIGSGSRQQYSVMGDAVNLGSRLCDTAGSGEIYCGPVLYDIVWNSFEFVAMPAIKLKGKLEPVRSYLLKHKKQKTSSFISKLIGRNKELQFLHEAVSVMQLKKGAIISVIGEGGIGKSRLLKECYKQFEGKVGWFEGRALSHLEHLSYVPAKEILNKLISNEAEPTAAVSNIILKKQLHLLNAEEANKLYPFLANLLELSITDEDAIVIRYLDPTELRDKIQNAFLRFIQLHSEKQSLVLVWEDLHWADEATLQLLSRLIKLSNERPLCNILLFRPQKNTTIWQMHLNFISPGKSSYNYLHLSPLSKNENSELIGSLFSITESVPEIEQLVFDKSEGNPFYIEELLRMLMNQGIIRVEANQIIYTASLENIKLPNTLHGIVASRIDQLNSDAKFVLQTASILGRIFNNEILSPLLQKSGKEIDLTEVLQNLVATDMIRIKEGRENEIPEFIFKHAITQEVAYDSMLIALRKELHKDAAEVIYNLYGDGQSSVIAYHFEKGLLLREALKFYLIAAANAEKIFAHENSLTFYDKAIEQGNLLLSSTKEAEWQVQLCKLYEKVGDIYKLQTLKDEALINYGKALLLVTEPAGIIQARIYRKQSLCYESSRLVNANEIKELQVKAAYLLENELDRTIDWWFEWLEMQFEKCWSLYFQLKSKELEMLVNEIKIPVETYGTLMQKIRYFTCLLLHQFQLNAYQLSEKTIDIARAAVESSLSIQDLQVRSMIGFELGFTYLWANQIELAIITLEECLWEAKKIGDKIIATRLMIYRIIAYRRKGNVKKTEDLIDEYLEPGQYANIGMYECFILANKTWACWKNRNLSEMQLNYDLTVVKWAPHLPFRFLYAMPMSAYFFEMKNIERVIDFFKEMCFPDQRRLEQEIYLVMQQVMLDYSEQRIEEVYDGIETILTMAKHYKYL